MTGWRASVTLNSVLLAPLVGAGDFHVGAVLYL